MKDFDIITSARQIHPTLSGSLEGYIVKYDGDMYFVYDPDETLNINDCVYWIFDIERHWCFNEIDTDFYRYTTLEYKPIDLNDIR